MKTVITPTVFVEAGEVAEADSVGTGAVAAALVAEAAAPLVLCRPPPQFLEALEV